MKYHDPVFPICSISFLTKIQNPTTESYAKYKVDAYGTNYFKGKIFIHNFDSGETGETIYDLVTKNFNFYVLTLENSLKVSRITEI